MPTFITWKQNNSRYKYISGHGYFMDMLNCVLSVDNDGHPPTVWTRPATRQPMRVKIGTMTVTYVATDASHHKTKCNFTIMVEGKKSSFTFYTNIYIILTINTDSSTA
jgi:hypothetical protein